MAEVIRLTEAQSRARLTGNSLKRCCRCEQLKRRFEFNKNSRNKDGLDNYCKQCRRELTAESYEKRREKYLADKALRAERKANVEPVRPVKAEPAREPLNDGNVVDTARLVMLQNGWTERRLAITALDELMTEANKLLFAAGHRQLGKNEAWLQK